MYKSVHDSYLSVDRDAMKFSGAFLIAALSFSILAGTISAKAATTVVVEYFYYDLSDWQCDDCPIGDYYRVDSLVRLVEAEYGDQISVEKLDVRNSTGENRERFNQYNLEKIPAIVINHGEHILEGTSAITDESLRAAIDESLGKGSWIPGLPYKFFSEAAAVFSMGLFSGISPCLMAMLAFILTYTAGTSDGLKRGTVRALIFGIGLIVAIILLGSLILSLSPTAFAPALEYLKIAAWISAGIMILIGLNLVGIFKLPFSTNPFNVAGLFIMNKFAFNVAGLFILGILFFFLKLPCAFPLFFVMLFEIQLATTFEKFLLLIIFSLGVLVPFMALGLIGGGTPKFARAISGRYRLTIRAISGLVLIVYGIWIMYQLVTISVYRIFP